jgi:hypothetical protein
MRHYNDTADMIESRYTVTEIRQFYAKLLAGRGKLTSLQDIASKHKTAAGEADIDECVRELARVWRRFSKTTCA